jgi:murein DD-endopeptidase MepM/ murein hydrolase activator NlpD
MSIGNPAIASALADLTGDRPSVIGNSPSSHSDAAIPETFFKTFRVKSGDTLSHILDRAGADGQTADNAIHALKEVFNPRDLRAGQTIRIAYSPASQSDSADRFTGFEIPLDYDTRVHVAPAPEGGFRAYQIDLALQTKQVRAEGTITDSLFAAGQNADVPTSVMAELVHAFSWDVDFQRDIRKNDHFEVMYERQVDESGRPVHNGRIVYAELTLSGERKPIYLHQLADGRWDYFDAKGQSAKKALMRTPIDGARLSSSFGKRKHPILGYSKMHTGTDFAAPRGTPIYAAGDGVVDFAGRKGGYGNYVRIRHNSEYSTAYGHMKAFNRGITPGKRVHQGQVIGFVGTTGMSTGPHLHFEVIRQGHKVNPMTVKMPSGKKLSGQELAKFEMERESIDTQWASLPNQGPQLAQK